jgi:hypothetical protein
MMALKRENISLKRRYEEFIGVLDFLDTMPDDAAMNVLRHLKSSRDPSTTLSSIKSGVQLNHQLSERRTARNFSPPTQSELEFELSIRHPISYPTLMPVDVTVQQPNPLLQTRRLRRKNVAAEILYDDHSSWRGTQLKASLALLLTPFVLILDRLETAHLQFLKASALSVLSRLRTRGYDLANPPDAVRKRLTKTLALWSWQRTVTPVFIS